jgi:hypothetical protein
LRARSFVRSLWLFLFSNIFLNHLFKKKKLLDHLCSLKSVLRWKVWLAWEFLWSTQKDQQSILNECTKQFIYRIVRYWFVFLITTQKI